MEKHLDTNYNTKYFIIGNKADLSNLDFTENHFAPFAAMSAKQ